jgi:hypothetical protein
VRTDRLPNRRFSGDGFLSPARYFILCQENGLDGGMMWREIMAYHDPLSAGVIDIRDLTETTGATGRGLTNDGSPDAASAPTGPSRLDPPFTAIEHEWLGQAARRWETTDVLVPVRVSEERFERVVDRLFVIGRELSSCRR